VRGTPNLSERASERGEGAGNGGSGLANDRIRRPRIGHTQRIGIAQPCLLIDL
jgi:hypothetical protein